MKKATAKEPAKQFDDSATLLLKKLKLSKSAIRELEEQLFQEARFQAHFSPIRPKALQEREQVDGLKRAVSELRGRMKSLEPFIIS
jgi:hypothetical protein